MAGVYADPYCLSTLGLRTVFMCCCGSRNCSVYWRLYKEWLFFVEPPEISVDDVSTRI